VVPASMMPEPIVLRCRIMRPYIGVDDTITYRPRLLGLCPLRRWVRLYSYNAYNVAICGPIFLIFIPN